MDILQEGLMRNIKFIYIYYHVDFPFSFMRKVWSQFSNCVLHLATILSVHLHITWSRTSTLLNAISYPSVSSFQNFLNKLCYFNRFTRSQDALLLQRWTNLLEPMWGLWYLWTRCPWPIRTRPPPGRTWAGPRTHPPVAAPPTRTEYPQPLSRRLWSETSPEINRKVKMKCTPEWFSQMQGNEEVLLPGSKKFFKLESEPEIWAPIGAWNPNFRVPVPQT